MARKRPPAPSLGSRNRIRAWAFPICPTPCRVPQTWGGGAAFWAASPKLCPHSTGEFWQEFGLVCRIWHRILSLSVVERRPRRLATMIYECDHCEEHLSPHALACPRCGQKFDEPVPSDATAPAGGAWHVPSAVRGKSAAARATIVLSGGPDASRPAHPRPRSFLKALLGVVLPVGGALPKEGGPEMPRRTMKIKH